MASAQHYILVRNQVHPEAWDVPDDHPLLINFFTWIRGNAGSISYICRGLYVAMEGKKQSGKCSGMEK